MDTQYGESDFIPFSASGTAGGGGDLASADPWLWASQLRERLGEDVELDTGILEEGWASGVPLGMEAYRVQREKVRPATVRSMTFAALDGWGSTSFVEQRKWMGGRGFEEQSTYEGSAYRATWLNDTGDRSYLQARDDAAQDSDAEEGRGEFFVAEQMGKMTRESACKILRVAKESSDLQLRAAYHRMVIAWHPDRQQQRSDMARAQATDRMVAINAAYRFLRVMQPTAQL